MLRQTLDNLTYSKPYLIVTAVAVVIFFPTWYRLTGIWLEFEQVLAHGLATAVIFLGLLLIHPPKPSVSGRTIRRPYTVTGSIFLIGVTLAWGVLELVRIDTLAFLMLPVSIVAVSWALLGLHRTLSFLPYVLLLALSLPFWADIVPGLVALASVVVGEGVRWFGMTALIEGSTITLPYGRLLIEDGCSGIRYFAVSILLATMASILNDYRWKGWVIAVAVAMLIGLIANWVRITILVVVAYETNMQSELLTDHEAMGWLVFGGFILPALYFSPGRKRSQLPVGTTTTVTVPKTGIAAVIIAFLIGPGALLLAKTSSGQSSPWTLELSGFQETRADTSLPLPLSLPGVLTNRTWRSGNTWVSLAQSQKADSDGKIVPYIPEMFERSTWQVEEQLEAGSRVYRNILTRDQVLMAQWYRVGSKSSESYREAKLLQIPATLTGESRFALVTIQIPCSRGNCNDASAKLENIRAAVSSQL
ncbi:exosortase/archaeosortase family protein [Marinobacter changyiensis]|uniref:exosortase/archaeosortase family protein n=1 Tax=Marinobacter changyiensis TaxID=2604091 RepID=UPI0012646D43|nr:exosortase/archaeosortase family protein [Marinobacter changyiensis]